MENWNVIINNFNLLLTLLTIAVVMGVILGTCAYLILLERKISAWVQDRRGPNRVGPFGLLQPIADGLKFLLKEQVVPRYVDRLFYFIGPSVAITTALLAFAVVPFGPAEPAPERPWPQTVAEERALDAERNFDAEVTDYYEGYEFVIAPGVDVGIVFVFAVGSLAVYAIILGGWSSNNKYSFLGSMRASAQVISYEIPLGMSVLGVAAVAGSLNLEKIVAFQLAHGWNVLFQPLAALLFIAAVFAETNRLPFDLSEAEQELVGGYHTEYSGMKFAMFFLGEYTHMITTSFLVMVLFFGGWGLFGLEGLFGGVAGVIVKLVILAVKMALFIVFYMLIRWTLPRFRFDQLMGLAWKVLIPLALAQLFAVLVVLQLGWSQWVLLPASLAILIAAGYAKLMMPPAPPPPPPQLRGKPVTETARI